MNRPIGDQESSVIRTERVSKYFPGVRALMDLNFEVNRGEVHALCGENGAGKSTLMKILVREYTEDEGDIFIGGQSVKDLGIRGVQKLGLNLIHQDLNLVPMLTVAHNICLGQEPVTRLGTIDWKAMRNKAENFLSEISSEISVDVTVDQLSISEQQLVAIARALTTRPRFLILDEPTARLDQKAIENLFSFLKKFKDKGFTAIYISHQLEEIYRICDRITVLRDGKKIITGSTEEIPQTELVKHMVGREIKEQVPKEIVPIGDVILSVNDLSSEKLSFLKKGKEETVSFDVKSGEILAIAGSIGAGKSEVARALFGIDRKESGSISISGREVNPRNPIEAIAAGIALVPEERRTQGLVGKASVRRNITLVSLAKEFCAAKLWIRQNKEKGAVKKSIDKLRIATPGTEQEVSVLSGGNQQKIVVGKWLFGVSDIYIFDEPTKGIDVGGKHEIYRLIVELAKQGAGVIFISNELPAVLSLCDRILVMYHGQIIKELLTQATNQQELLFFVMGGKDYGKESNNIRADH
jgi:ribose transport system ATP-binding protein